MTLYEGQQSSILQLGILGLKFIYITMLPFNNNSSNQNYPQLYSHPAYFANPVFYVPEEVAAMMNHSIMDNQNYSYPFHFSFSQNFPSYPVDAPVKFQQRKTKPRQTKQSKQNKDEQEVFQINGEYDDNSPQQQLKQKYGRNVNSNIFRHMLKKLLVVQDFGEIISRILKRESSCLTLLEYMEMMNRKQQKLTCYVSYQKMRKMFKGQKYRNKIYEITLKKQREFLKIFRILCRYYLKNVHVLHVYNVLKIKDESKGLHIAGSRKILQLMQPY